MNVNMVFTIPTEFHAPTEDVTELALGVEHAVFEKPKNSGKDNDRQGEEPVPMDVNMVFNWTHAH
jgi:hypothetical protein